MALRHLTSINVLDERQIETIFKLADAMRPPARGRHGVNESFAFRPTTETVANLFYEPSTRTAASFHIAATRLGASVYSCSDVQFSSLAKGESLEDTIRIIGGYADAIVLRHPDHVKAVQAMKTSPVPIINAGSGGKEHPTQALLDLYTIRQQLGGINMKTVGVMGDLKNGRAAQSLIRLLRRYDVRIKLIAPDILQLPNPLQTSRTDQRFQHLDDCIEELDVLYVTRFQRERMSTLELSKIGGHASYEVRSHHMKRAKAGMIVMHPLPRLSELPREIDKDPRAVYFQQAENGLYVRMALLWAMMRGML